MQKYNNYGKTAKMFNAFFSAIVAFLFVYIDFSSYLRTE